MAIDMKYDHAVGALVTTLTGAVTFQDLADHSREVEAVLRDKDIKLRILDLSAVEEVKADSEQIAALAGLNRKVMIDHPVKDMLAVVSNDFQYGLCRMWEAYAGLGDDVLLIFRSRKQARDWLRKHYGDEIL